MDIAHFIIVFKSLYLESPIVAFCPVNPENNISGALCPLDYNNQVQAHSGVYVAVSGRNDLNIHLYAEGIKQTHKASLEERKETSKGWAEQVLDVAFLLNQDFGIRGFNLYISSDLTFEAAFNLDSISISLAVFMALNQLNKLKIPDEDFREKLILRSKDKIY